MHHEPAVRRRIDRVAGSPSARHWTDRMREADRRATAEFPKPTFGGLDSRSMARSMVEEP